MKKSLIVLLIAVLALSSVFAAITGSTTASYKVDFAEKNNVKFTYAKPGTTGFDAEIELDYQAIQALGEGNAYVDFEAEATIDAGYGYNGSHSKEWKAANAFGVYDLDFSISKADIVAGKWTINLLKAKVGADYAQSAIDTKKIHGGELEEAVVPYTYKYVFSDVKTVEASDEIYVIDNSSSTPALAVRTDADDVLDTDIVLYDASTAATKLGNGITVSYDGFNLGLSFEKGVDELENPVSEFKLGLETKEFGLDEFKFQTAVAFASKKVEATTNEFAVSAKASYADNFTVAADFGFGTDAALDFDLSANLTYDPLTVDFYYATTANAYDTIYPNGKVLDDDVKDRLSVKGALDFASFDVPIKLTVTAQDIKKDAEGATEYHLNKLSVEASTTAVDGLEIAMYLKDALYTRLFGGKLTFTGVEGLTLTAEANYQLGDYKDESFIDIEADKEGTFWTDLKAEYKAAKFTVKGETEIRFNTDSQDYNFLASIESDKLVDGATLSLTYKYVNAAMRNLKCDVKGTADNYLKAACKVAF